jgi:anti-anti-sigma factor
MEQKRQSRADRRKSSAVPPGVGERRKGLPLEVRCLSQVVNGELVIYVQDPIAAENCASAERVITQHLKEHGEKSVVFDMHKCTYIDTPGLTTLFEIRKRLAAEGRIMGLQNPSRAVLRMLNITLLNRVFPVRFTTDEEERIPTSKLRDEKR